MEQQKLNSMFEYPKNITMTSISIASTCKMNSEFLLEVNKNKKMCMLCMFYWFCEWDISAVCLHENTIIIVATI